RFLPGGPGSIQPSPRVLAVDELHGQHHGVAEGADVVDRHDPGVGEPGHGARLGEQARAQLVVVGRARPDHLERDLPVQLGVVGRMDHPHGPAAQALADDVSTDLQIGPERIVLPEETAGSRRVEGPGVGTRAARQLRDQPATVGAPIDVRLDARARVRVEQRPHVRDGVILAQAVGALGRRHAMVPRSDRSAGTTAPQACPTPPTAISAGYRGTVTRRPVWAYLVGDPVTDEELMDAYAAGSLAAFDSLFARLAPRVHAFFVRSFGDVALADDLLQVTFMKLHRARADYRSGSPLRSWLFSIAARVRLDELRRRRRLREDVDAET